MPPGWSSWLRRSVGLALSRHSLRRSLVLQEARGDVPFATVISTRPIAGDAGTTAGMPAGAEFPRVVRGWWTTTTSPSNRMAR